MKSRYIFLSVICIASALNVAAWFINNNQSQIQLEDDFVTYNTVTMKQSDAESVLSVISAEGFDNAFNHQSTFKDINDVKFHELRRAYIAASKELANYIADAAGKPEMIPYYMSFDN